MEDEGEPSYFRPFKLCISAPVGVLNGHRGTPLTPGVTNFKRRKDGWVLPRYGCSDPFSE